MGTAPGNSGLKGQWGVSNPQSNAPAQDAGSDQQANDFKAAFEKEQGVINGHLQYTSANAEASAHGGFASRRDALYGAFQGALGQIDRTNPAKAQGAIDKVLGDARALSGEVTTFRQAAEKAKNDWDAKQGKYDESVRQIEELEAWEDKQAAALRGQADSIRTQTNERRYAEACTALDAMLAQLAPVYEEYVRQKAAKAEYEPQRDALEPRATAATGSDRAKLQAERDAVGTARDAMEASAQEKNFVQALEQLGDVTAKVEAFEAALEELDRKKQEFEAAKAELQTKMTQVEQSTFKKLESKQQDISGGMAAIDAAAETEDYDQAMTLASELSIKCDEYQAEVTKLEEQRKAYDEAWAALQPRFEQTAQSEFKKLEPMQQELTAIKGEIDAAVEAEDFEQALAKVNDLSSKVDTYLADVEQARQKRQAYEEAWAEVGPKCTEALQCSSTKLAPQRDALGASQQQVDAAVAEEDFEQALALATDLGTKADEYLEAERVLAEQKARYDLAMSTLQPELDSVANSGGPALAPLNEEIARIRGEMEAAVAEENYERAVQHADDLTSKIKTYKDELAKARQQYEERLAPVEAGMKEVSESGYSELEARKAELTSAYDAMIKLAGQEDYQGATAAAESLAPQVRDFAGLRQRASGTVQQKIHPRLEEIEAGMAAFAKEKSDLVARINALINSIRLESMQGDAKHEQAAKRMDELQQLFGQLKDDPCLKAKRSPEYQKAVEAEMQAKAEAKPLWTTLEKAKLDYLKPLSGQQGDPRQDLEVKKAEEAVRAAELKRFLACKEINRVLGSFQCKERVDEVMIEP